MEIKTERDSQSVQSDKVWIKLGDVTYRISTKDGKLVLNKVDDSFGGDDTISVSPSCSNEIKIS